MRRQLTLPWIGIRLLSAMSAPRVCRSGWAIDFIHDTNARGRPLKWLRVVDEFTRECVALVVDRSMSSRGVAEVLIDLFTTRGVPSHNARSQDAALPASNGLGGVP